MSILVVAGQAPPKNLTYVSSLYREVILAISMASTDALRILVIGAGGREHALAWRLSKSPRVERIFIAPGNGGTASEHKSENVDIAADDFPGLVAFAFQQEVGHGCRSA
jgi:shikimate 5-dehydrogenase